MARPRFLIGGLQTSACERPLGRTTHLEVIDVPQYSLLWLWWVLLEHNRPSQCLHTVELFCAGL